MSRARLVVFPIKGRNWCFVRSLDSASSHRSSSSPPPQLKDLWTTIIADGRSVKDNAETVADFVAEKMSRAWSGLEKAPAGSFKSKLHSLGVRLLSRVKPSEIFLKSILEDVKEVEITYPASLNPRLVRRRLRHIAMRGSADHKKYFYGSVSLLPVTTVFSVLPLPNIPFFWISFRAYSNWRALKGSERLLLLVSDCSRSRSLLNGKGKETGSKDDSKLSCEAPWLIEFGQWWSRNSGQLPLFRARLPVFNEDVRGLDPTQVLQPSKDLERLLADKNAEDDVKECTIARICKEYDLEENDVLKYKKLI